MYELYPKYSTVHENFFFSQDEREPVGPLKLSAEEINEARNDWFDGLRRLGQEKREEFNNHLNDMISANTRCDSEEDGEEYEETDSDVDSDSELELESVEGDDEITVH